MTTRTNDKRRLNKLWEERHNHDGENLQQQITVIEQNVENVTNVIGENTGGAFIHLSLDATQSIASTGELISWTVGGDTGLTLFEFAEPSLPIEEITIPKPGYYNVAVQLGWDSFTGGGNVKIYKDPLGSPVEVWPPAEDPGLWTTTAAQYFEGTAPAIFLLAGETLGVWVDPDDASAQDLASATVAVYLVDHAPGAPIEPPDPPVVQGSVGGNRIVGADVSYNVTPNWGGAVTAELFMVNDTLSDWNTGSRRPADGQGHDIHQAYNGNGVGWTSMTAGDLRTITFDIGEARGGDWFSIAGFYDENSSVYRPTEATLEFSDNGSDWTVVESLTSLSAVGVGGSRGWLIRFPITDEGNHRYWRFTLEAGGTAMNVGLVAIHAGVYVTEGKSYTFDVSPSVTAAGQPIDVIEGGESDYTDNKSTQLATLARDHAGTPALRPNATLWAQSVNSTVTITTDLEASTFAHRLFLKGYYGTADVYRPISIVIEYSDNGSTWSEFVDTGTLTGGGQPGHRQWIAAFNIGPAGAHRYWRATLEHGGDDLALNSFELWNTWFNSAAGTAYTATASPVDDGNWPGASLLPGDSDWNAAFNVVTNGERAYTEDVPQPYWLLNSGQTVFARIDLGSAKSGTQIVATGCTFASGTVRSPNAILIEYSDNDSDWTTVVNKTGLTVHASVGRWLGVFDISDAGSHRYWRGTITCGVNSTHLSYTQLEFWERF